MMNQNNIYAAIVPHAPNLLEYQMDSQPSPVITALEDLGRRLKQWGVSTVVAVSTHWQTANGFYVDNAAQHPTITDYYGFRTEVEYDVDGNPALAQRLIEAGKKDLLFVTAGRHGVDHAVTIPLHFMFPDRDVPVVPLSIAATPLEAFRWGRSLRRALSDSDEKVLFLASGSLSHDLAAYQRGKSHEVYERFDQAVLGLVNEGRGMEVLELDPELIALAKPEGGFRDLLMLLGVNGSKHRGIVKAYESLPGVGLGVIEFESEDKVKQDFWLS